MISLFFNQIGIIIFIALSLFIMNSFHNRLRRIEKAFSVLGSQEMKNQMLSIEKDFHSLLRDLQSDLKNAEQNRSSQNHLGRADLPIGSGKKDKFS